MGATEDVPRCRWCHCSCLVALSLGSRAICNRCAGCAHACLVGGAGLVSLSMPRLGADVYVRHDKGLVYRSRLPAGGSGNGAAMDASFRVVVRAAQAGCAHADGRNLRHSCNNSRMPPIGSKVGACACWARSCALSSYCRGPAELSGTNYHPWGLRSQQAAVPLLGVSIEMCSRAAARVMSPGCARQAISPGGCAESRPPCGRESLPATVC